MIQLNLEDSISKRGKLYDTASELSNELLGIYFDKCYDLFDATRSKIDSKYNSINLRLDENDYEEWNKEESDYSTVKDDEKKLMISHYQKV